ncbi:Alpha/Beta hydrolase protein [Fomitopsis serialis]|uniref:Alpha/Beta hydrolase protein n=1 Tax=Fomitopsis serialis TaxID=139415 RepID=UPI002007433D|nr:Alpha/Beta hydrolase protein [Neoantrodia serialis]KAH9916822.1 Alpha/Beta hydrolase protein [Neoantrodia serialis]
MSTTKQVRIDPGHPYAKTKHISFEFYKQTRSASAFGYEYFVSLPPSYDADSEKRWPLVFFLHGAGESQRGKKESYATLRHGVPKIILCYDRLKDGLGPKVDIPLRGGQRVQKEDLSATPVPASVCEFVAERFITVTPSLNMQYGYGWNAPALSSLLDEIVEDYRVDIRRVHATGFSMGGYGTWELAQHSPRRFASLVPICGGGEPLLALNIKHIPQWIHHGERDDIISISQSKEMYEALQQIHAPQVKFCRYPGLGHDSWTEAYNQLELWEWMVDQSLPEGSGEVQREPTKNKANVEHV